MHLVILTRHSETIVDDVVLGPGFQRTRNIVMHLSALRQAGRPVSAVGIFLGRKRSITVPNYLDAGLGWRSSCSPQPTPYESSPRERPLCSSPVYYYY